MIFDDLLKKSSIQKQIDRAVKKYKNKKVLIYGTGLLSEAIFRNYDLSALNIVGIVNIKYGSMSATSFLDKSYISLQEIKNIDFDVVLIANEEYARYKNQLENFLYKNNIERKFEIKPLVKLKTKNKTHLDLFIQALYIFSNPSEFVKLILKTFSVLNSFYILNSRLRENKRQRLYNSYLTKLYGYQVLNFAKSVGKNFWCRGFSNVTRNTVLGDNVNFNGMEIVGKGRVSIGNYFHSGKDCLIIADNHNYNCGQAIPYDNKIIERDVEINDFVWFGSRVIILPGTKIGEGVVVQAGSVVHGNIPDYAVVGGNPATVIKYRDIERFKQLKAEKKFR